MLIFIQNTNHEEWLVFLCVLIDFLDKHSYDNKNHRIYDERY